MNQGIIKKDRRTFLVILLNYVYIQLVTYCFKITQGVSKLHHWLIYKSYWQCYSKYWFVKLSAWFKYILNISLRYFIQQVGWVESHVDSKEKMQSQSTPTELNTRFTFFSFLCIFNIGFLNQQITRRMVPLLVPKYLNVWISLAKIQWYVFGNIICNFRDV